MKLISVIVPVYKVEAYLDRCVQSIVDQTYQNLEIILVDDGSPDNCPAMCDAWAEKDCRIKVIHTVNQGSGRARNIALDSANGELVAFVDSDDFIAPQMLEHLYSLLNEEIDIAECRYVSTYDDSADFTYCGDIMETGVEDALKAHIKNECFQQVIWNKLYKREVIGDIRFPTQMKIDDEFFTYQVLARAERLICSSRVCYAYRQQNDSIMHTVPVRIWLQAIDAKILRHEYMLRNFPNLACYSLKSVLGSMLYVCQLAFRTAEKESRIEILRKYKDILVKYPPNVDMYRIMSMKERMWLTMSMINMTLTCRVRNLMKIGL